MKTEKNLFTKNEFAALYENLNSDRDLMDVLSKMQVEHGIHERKAYENADALIRMVAERENLCSMLSEDAAQVLDTFLNESDRMTGYDRKIQLQKLAFGLKLYQDNALLDKLKEGADYGQLFHEYYTENEKDSSVTCETLEEDVRNLMANYHISSKAMRHFVKRLEEGEGLVATSAALGQEGLRFKCVAAMDLYLRNQKTMTVEDAVNTACADVEIQAVADAVAKGQLTEERALKIISIAVSAAIILGIVLLLARPLLMEAMTSALTDPFWIGNVANLGAGMEGAVTATGMITGKMVKTANTLLIGGTVVSWISELVAQWMGELSAKRCFRRHMKESEAVKALNQMADHVEAKEKTQQKTEWTGETVREEAADTVRQTQRAHAFG